MKHLIKIGLIDVTERCGVYIVLSVDLCKVLSFLFWPRICHSYVYC